MDNYNDNKNNAVDEHNDLHVPSSQFEHDFANHQQYNSEHKSDSMLDAHHSNRPLNTGHNNYHQPMRSYQVLQKPQKRDNGAFIVVLILLALLFSSAIFIVIFYSSPVKTINDDSIQYNSSDYIEYNGDDYSVTPPVYKHGEDIGIEQSPKPNLGDSNEHLLTAVGVAKKVGKSVVEIWTYTFAEQVRPSGQGSGIVLTSDGYIITNAHVIESTNRVLVKFSDDTEYEASLVGMDIKTDIAVLKVDVNGLDAAIFGNSDELELGEDIITIGSPSGLTGTVTKGIVSGLNRRIVSDYDTYQMNCIQIDAAISPGNSGGALVNMYGQVVGINSSKYVSHEIEGIGFAISINEAKPIVESLIKHGEIKGRVRIGIVFIPVTDTVARMSDEVAGLHIQSIDDECDIATSGLRINDVITHIDSSKVTSVEQVHDLIKHKAPGDTVTATVYREHSDEGDIFEISFKLESDD